MSEELIFELTEETFEFILDGTPVTVNEIINWIDEPLTGTINDSNVLFKTSFNYQDNSTVVFINGIRQNRGIDYIEQNGNEILFSEAPSSVAFTDNLTIIYKRA